MHEGKRDVIDALARPTLPRGHEEADWTRQVRGIESRYCRAIGSAQALSDKASRGCRRWLRFPRSPGLSPRGGLDHSSAASKKGDGGN